METIVMPCARATSMTSRDDRVPSECDVWV
jgi:hypothetical protein